MRNRHTGASRMVWMLAPLFGVACDLGKMPFEEWYPGSFPDSPRCQGSDQVLSSDKTGQLVCKRLPPGAAALPDCKKYSQALTSDGTDLFCTDRNDEAQATRDALDALEQSEILIREYQIKINSLGGPVSPAPRAIYCGQYSASPNSNGAISDAGLTGVAAAVSLCRKAPGCSSSKAKMCTVYDLYYSAATGKLPATVLQSWVFMASWQHNNPAQVPTGQGLADSCSGYTYGQDDKLWYGTTVEWKDAPSGHKALHFASGPGVVTCDRRFPIACCN